MREVSTQQEADITNLRAIARDIDFLFTKDPAVSLQSGGLHLMCDEILNDISDLTDDMRYWYKCRRCGKPKIPITIGKADIAQMFKCIHKASVMSGYVKLAKRVKSTTRNTAILEKRDRAGRRYTTFAKRKFVLKGTKCFSYVGRKNDIHMALRWSNQLQLSKLGTVYVRRRRGMAMGHTLSSSKGGIVLRQMEIDWLSATETHSKHRFTKENEKWHNVIGGKRYADDIMLYSKVCCESCLQEWLSHLYQPPMIPEWEGSGWNQTMCDLNVQVVLSEKGYWIPRIRKLDKNESFLLGFSLYPARARFAPNIDKTPRAHIRSWVIGGWTTEARRAHGTDAYDTAELIKIGAFRLIGELLLLGHSEKLLRSIIHSVHQPEIRWIVHEVAKWLDSLQLYRYSASYAYENRIKTDLWNKTLELNLLFSIT